MDGLIEQISSVNRPKLGEEIPVVIFRAFRLFTEFHLDQVVGHKGSISLLQHAGRELGKQVGKNLIDKELDTYIERVSNFVYDQKIGILIPVNLGNNSMLFRLDECITCAGMPNIGKRICHFEAGFVGGIVETFLGRRVKVYETKCNAMGEGTCEVKVELSNA